MALVPITLEEDLMAIFDEMDGILDGTGDKYQAVEMARALKEYTLTGVVTTTDAGIVGESSFTGQGTGSMTLNIDNLAKDLHVTFIESRTNDELAARMAIDINKACTETDIVSSENEVGPGIGSFSGVKSLIENPLRACFSAMNGMMTGGGNEFYARQLGEAITDYLRAGTITVRLLPPFSSGSGSGGIA